MNRAMRITGVLVFIMLLILSVIFENERIIFSDAAFYLYTMVRNGDFAIFHDRFIALFSQTGVLYGIKEGWSLQWLIHIFSIFLAGIQMIAFLLTSFIDKTGRLSLAVLLLNVLLVTKTFFWPMSELTQGMAFLLVYFALLIKWQGSRIATIIFSILLLPVICFSHPFILLPFSFLILYFLLKQSLDKQTVIFAGGIFLFLLVLKFTVFRDPYDKGALGGLRNFILFFPDYFSLFSNKEFLRKTVSDYAVWTIMLLIVVQSYFAQKKWRLLGLMLLYTIACIGFVNVCFPYAKTPDFYRENLYLPLALFVGVPFIYDVLPTVHSKKIQAVIIGIICAAGLIRIYNAHSFFTARLHWLTQFWYSNKDKKLIIPETEEHRKLLGLSWGTPYEIWLLSTAKNGATSSLMILDSMKMLPEYKGEGDVFIHRFAAEPYRAFPHNYFHFNDSTTAYHILKME